MKKLFEVSFIGLTEKQAKVLANVVPENLVDKGQVIGRCDCVRPLREGMRCKSCGGHLR